MNTNTTTTTKPAAETLRPCEACGRPEHTFKGVYGPPRCISCHLFAYEAIDAGATCNDIAPGYPATISIGSDSRPGTVRAVERDADGEIKTITVAFDVVAGGDVDDASGQAERTITWTRRKTGAFVERGVQRSGFHVTVGVRVDHTDMDT